MIHAIDDQKPDKFKIYQKAQSNSKHLLGAILSKESSNGAFSQDLWIHSFYLKIIKWVNGF